MAPYEPFDPEVEVHGRTVLAVVDEGLARFSEGHRERARETLADHGVEAPAADEWYPQSAWLATFETVAADLDRHLLDRLGEQIPTVADWPNGEESVTAGLRTVEEAYRRNHRGLIRAVARRSSPVETFVYVEETGEECRRDGADACTYTVHW